MKGLFRRRRFTGFGSSNLGATCQPPALYRVQGGRGISLRRCVRRDCPRRPGVYGMLDAGGELIYVGKAKSLRARLLCYFRPKSRDPKAGKILRNTRTIVWEFASSEFAALVRELELIQRWAPCFNVRGRPGRRRSYVCLGRPPAPYAFLFRRPPADAVAFGPVPGGLRAREAVRRVNDCFGLRDCPSAQEMVFADQTELFPAPRAAGCIRYEIGTCLGPCAAACSRVAYARRVRAARAFLDGSNLSVLGRLERGMCAAAKAQQFERAAALRDKLEALRWLHDRLLRVREATERLSFVYSVRGHGGMCAWYLIHRGRVIDIVFPADEEEARRSLTEKINNVFQNDANRQELLASEETDSVLMVAAWFRRHPEELARTLPAAEALAALSRERMAWPADRSA